MAPPVTLHHGTVLRRPPLSCRLVSRRRFHRSPSPPSPRSQRQRQKHPVQHAQQSLSFHSKEDRGRLGGEQIYLQRKLHTNILFDTRFEALVRARWQLNYIRLFCLNDIEDRTAFNRLTLGSNQKLYFSMVKHMPIDSLIIPPHTNTTLEPAVPHYVDRKKVKTQGRRIPLLDRDAFFL